MKLRYERGALADLDEIFTYIAGENREAAMRLAARFEEWQGELRRTRSSARRRASRDSGDFQLATI